jgi:ParB-like chromosome segregation protein Spo0J
MNLAMNPMQPHPRNNLTEMYPGIYQSGQGEDGHDGPNLPTAPLNTLLGFELETYQVPLDQLLPSKKVPDGVMSTRKYKQIVSSINEVGLIEPLSVIQPDRKKSEYLVLDGHLRVLAFKELGMSVGPCLLARDDETFSYNHHINRLSTIAEHYMIRRAIDRGVSKERLARAFNVNLSSINQRINLLEGICPEAITLLQDKQFTPDVTRILRNMKAARQVEAVELMIASNTITVAHAEALLKATPPEQRTDVKPAEREKKTAPIEQIEKLEKDEPGAGVLHPGRRELRLRLAQPGGGQRLSHQAAGQRGRQELHRPPRAGNPDSPGAGREHRQHGRGGAAATGSRRLNPSTLERYYL